MLRGVRSMGTTDLDPEVLVNDPQKVELPLRNVS